MIKNHNQLLCRFCKSVLLKVDNIELFCPNCNPKIHYMQIINNQIIGNQIIGFIVKKNEKYTIYYDYFFDQLKFRINIVDNLKNDMILIKSFKNIKISSAKELEDFGDRMYNLLIFI